MKHIKTFNESNSEYLIGDMVYADLQLPSFHHHVGKIIEIDNRSYLIEFGEGLRATERWVDVSKIKNKIKRKKNI
jgi:hypothetical protein